MVSRYIGDIEKDPYYVQGDNAGRSGVELSYEEALRGVKGVEILLRDAHGRIKGRYEEGRHDVAPVSGKNLTLSIDMDLQAIRFTNSSFVIPRILQKSSVSNG